MERLLIILAVLVCVGAGIAVISMSARGRREPLRMGAELDREDEHLLIGSVGTPDSPIDRQAEVLHPGLFDPDLLELELRDLKLIETPKRTDRIEPPRPDMPGTGR